LVFIKYKTIKKRKRKKRTNVQPRSRSLTMAIERTLSRRKKRRCKPLENQACHRPKRMRTFRGGRSVGGGGAGGELVKENSKSIKKNINQNFQVCFFFIGLFRNKSCSLFYFLFPTKVL